MSNCIEKFLLFIKQIGKFLEGETLLGLFFSYCLKLLKYAIIRGAIINFKGDNFEYADKSHSTYKLRKIYIFETQGTHLSILFLLVPRSLKCIQKIIFNENLKSNNSKMAKYYK